MTHLESLHVPIADGGERRCFSEVMRRVVNIFDTMGQPDRKFVYQTG